VIGRRELLGLLGGAIAASPATGHAQQGDRLSRVGVLISNVADDEEARASGRGRRDAEEDRGR
jgi:hypothetical protein